MQFLSFSIHWSDLPTLLLLILLDCFLSVDNAIVVALAAKSLPVEKRPLFHRIGFLSSLALRILAIGSISVLIQYSFLQGVGGLYLIYLAFSHLIFPKQRVKKKGHSLIGTLVIVELNNLAFSLDSVLLGLSLARWGYPQDTVESRVWMIYVGAFFGLITVRGVASFFLFLLERYPWIEKAAHLLLLLVGIELLVEGFFKS